jgi:hypothetical protein
LAHLPHDDVPFVEFVLVFVHPLGPVGAISRKTKTFYVFVLVIVRRLGTD